MKARMKTRRALRSTPAADRQQRLKNITDCRQENGAASVCEAKEIWQ